MGVDFYNCNICDEIFNDCGDYGICSNCEGMMCDTCHQEMVKKYGNPEIGSDAERSYGDMSSIKCDICSGVIVTDKDIVDYIIDITGNTKQELEDKVRRWRDIDNE